MKVKIIATLTLVFIMCAFTSLSAQNYAKLWKEAEAMEKKDLPKSAQEITEQIYKKAFDEKNTPEMMKAYLYRMHYRENISPDSFFVDLRGLTRWSEVVREPKDAAILNSMLGEIYGELLVAYYNPYSRISSRNIFPVSADDWSATALIQKSLKHFRLSLKNQSILAQAEADEYQPVIIKGASSSYFANDLLHMLSLRAVASLQKNTYVAEQYYTQSAQVDKYEYWNRGDFTKATIKSASEADYKAEILKIYQQLIGYYTKEDNKQALLIADLGRLNYINDAILLYSDYRNTNDKKLTDSPYYKQLADMLPEYQKYDAVIELYIRMSEFARQQNDLVTALKLAKEGIAKYGRSKRANQLKNIQSEILLPSFYAYADDSVYPETTLDLHVNYRNLTNLQMKIYTVNSQSDSELLNNYKEKTFRNTYTKLLSTSQFNLSPTTDYQGLDTIFRITAPAEGLYMIELDPGKKGVEPSYNLLYVSKIKVISRRLPGDQYEFVVVDGKTGHPLPEAEMQIYKNADNKLTELKKFVTDSTGTIVCPYDKSYATLRAKKDNDVSMKPVPVGYSYFREGKIQKDREILNLFTDRSIYRPGQTVYVAGIAYNQEKDSTNVIENKNYNVQLFDVNNKVVSEKYMRTNEFGSFSGEFIIPSSVLTGRFSIRVGDTSTSIQVEEYKRPTFDVVFSPLEGTYSSGDYVMANGRAKTFSGVPLRNTKVKYTVTRHAPLFWRWMGAPKTLVTGEVMTDTEGAFSISVYLEPNEEFAKLPSWYSTYTVEAVVTDAAGETETGSTNLQVGSSSLILSTDMPDDLQKEGSGNVTFFAKNLNQQPVTVTGKYNVSALFEDNGKTTVGGSVISGSFTSNESFSPLKLRALPSGAYRLSLSAADQQNRTVNYEKDFILYSIDDTIPPVKRMNWFHEISNEFSANKPASLVFGTSGDSVYVIYDVFSGDKHLKNERLEITNSVLKLEYPYNEEYGDGILVQLTFIKDGIFYQNESRITKERPEKKLNMKWEVFRDKLKPGQHEEWKLSIERPDGEPAEAELLATLYDASLDVLQKHNWTMNLSFPRTLPYIKWNISNPYSSYFFFNFQYKPLEVQELIFNDLLSSPQSNLLYSFIQNNGGRYYKNSSRVALTGMVAKADVAEDAVFEEEIIYQKTMPVAESGGAGGEAGQTVQLRENFSETAFFYPHLRTDEEGKIKFSFTMPESLTEWNFMGISHNKKMDWGKLTGKTVVSKEFMLAPNMPRFIRMGDINTLAANVMNLSERGLSGSVTLQLVDPATDKTVYTSDAHFYVEPGTTKSVSFTFTINREDLQLLVCRIIAKGGSFSDGEQHYIPVLSNKVRVTETIPVFLNGKLTRDYSLDNLYNRNSRTATNRSLTIEYTGNPAWYAVQALPSLSEPKNDDAISWATAYYANNMAAHIMKAYPRIQSTFNAWKAQSGSKETLWSNLQKNEELKNVLLEETPWLMEAENEADQKKRLALLFDLNNIQHNNTIALRKLQTLQLHDGSWSWYQGMTSSRYTTQSIIEMLTKLKTLTGSSFDEETQQMYDKAFEYIDAQVVKEYQQMLELEKSKVQFLQVPELTVQYLYISSISGRVVNNDNTKKAQEYFINKLSKSITQLSVYGKALAAIVLHKNDRKTEAEDFMTSLQQYAVMTKDMGLYYEGNTTYYAWYNYRIPTQTAVIEATELISKNERFIEEMKVWLLKQKQTQMWDSNVSTVNAIYALLNNNDNLLDNKGSARITVGNKIIDVTPSNSLVPGMGYVKRSFAESDLTDVRTVSITTRENGLAWGAIYAQYQEEIDKVTPLNNIFSVNKRLFVERMVGDKMQLVPLTEGEQLFVGNKVVSRLTVRSDRDVDFVHLRDQRPACFEPFIKTSGYKGQAGTGYYIAIKDASSEFYFDTLRKGSYVIEQSFYVSRAGEYASGITQLQSVYAPEFTVNIESIRVKVD